MRKKRKNLITHLSLKEVYEKEMDMLADEEKVSEQAPEQKHDLYRPQRPEVQYVQQSVDLTELFVK
jgi:hypothetical protein